MFEATDTAWAPWFVARSEIKNAAPEYYFASAFADPV
jgi:polyphosphate kinase 2 (PPK2 family)